MQTVLYNLLLLSCSTCFERYFRSSSGASNLYLQLLVLHTYVAAGWYHGRVGIAIHLSHDTKYSLDASDCEGKYLSKHVEQPRNNKLSYTVCIFLVIFVNYSQEKDIHVPRRDSHP